MAKKLSKIIFLEFDGVLNTEYHQRQLQFEGKRMTKKAKNSRFELLF